jgi:hypothetical protein
VDPFLNKSVDWIGTVVRPVKPQDYLDVDDPSRAAASVGLDKTSCFFWLEVSGIRDAVALEPRNVLVYSNDPFPDLVRHGAMVRVQGTIAGVEHGLYRHMVLLASRIERTEP